MWNFSNVKLIFSCTLLLFPISPLGKKKKKTIYTRLYIMSNWILTKTSEEFCHLTIEKSLHWNVVWFSLSKIFVAKRSQKMNDIDYFK